jgi:hypothetical protein
MINNQKTKHLIMFIVVVFVFAAAATGVWAYQRYTIKDCATVTAGGVCYTDVPGGANQVTRLIKNLDQNKKYNLIVKKQTSNGQEVEVGTIPVDMNQVHNSNKCTDSDGGVNYYLQGNLEWTTQNFKTADKCDGNTLTEYYCYGDMYQEKKFFCEGGCINGACKLYTAPAPNTGTPPVEPGTAPTNPPTVSGGIIKWGEMCHGDNDCVSGLACKYSGRYGDPSALYSERYCCKTNECASVIPDRNPAPSTTPVPHCVGNGGTDESMSSSTLAMTLICYNGTYSYRDINRNSPNCSDTDYGKNYFKKGHINWTVQGYEADDYCKDGKTVHEYYCGEDTNNTYVEEDVLCPTPVPVCKDGACI